MQMHVDGDALPHVRPPRVDSAPPPRPAPAPSSAPPREAVTVALARLMLGWQSAGLPVLVTSAAVGVYLGAWRPADAHGALLAAMLCERVDARGVPWTGAVILNDARALDVLEVDAPDSLTLTTPRSLRETFDGYRAVWVAPRWRGGPDDPPAFWAPALVLALEAFAETPDDPLAVWRAGDGALHFEGPGYRVVAWPDDPRTVGVVHVFDLAPATIEGVLSARLARKGDRL